MNNHYIIKEIEYELKRQNITLQEFYEELCQLKTEGEVNKDLYLYNITCKFLTAIESYNLENIHMITQPTFYFPQYGN